MSTRSVDEGSSGQEVRCHARLEDGPVFSTILVGRRCWEGWVLAAANSLIRFARSLKHLVNALADIKYGVQTKASPDQSQTDSAGSMHRDRVGERLEWLSQHLNLTEDQKKQLKDVSLTQRSKGRKDGAIHEALRPQVQAVLTPEQQQKFAQMKEEAKERRGDKKDKGESDHQPPQ
jgi:Spy/CpxP family protein refolding chaperone